MGMCIYHGNCADGFGAAWVVRKALGEIDFHPGKYQEPPPDVTGKDVVMVDFSYKRQVLLEMAEKANSILILDHHKTAVEDLVDLPANVTAKFDMGHSGAMMTWEHFFPGQEPPPLLLHIEDRDLWRFALQNTRQIQANVFSFPYDFQVWDMLMATAPDELAAEGEEQDECDKLTGLCLSIAHALALYDDERIKAANAALRGAEPASSAERPLEGTVMRKGEEC